MTLNSTKSNRNLLIDALDFYVLGKGHGKNKVKKTRTGPQQQLENYLQIQTKDFFLFTNYSSKRLPTHKIYDAQRLHVVTKFTHIHIYTFRE